MVLVDCKPSHWDRSACQSEQALGASGRCESDQGSKKKPAPFGLRTSTPHHATFQSQSQEHLHTSNPNLQVRLRERRPCSLCIAASTVTNPLQCGMASFFPLLRSFYLLHFCPSSIFPSSLLTQHTPFHNSSKTNVPKPFHLAVVAVCPGMHALTLAQWFCEAVLLFYHRRVSRLLPFSPFRIIGIWRLLDANICSP